MDSALSIHIGSVCHEPCICLTGEMDLANADELSPALLEDFPRDATVIHLDITGLRFMDSSGLHRIVQLHRAAKRSGVQLRVRVRDGSIIQRLIHTVGADTVLSVEGGAPLACVPVEEPTPV